MATGCPQDVVSASGNGRRKAWAAACARTLARRLRRQRVMAAVERVVDDVTADADAEALADELRDRLLCIAPIVAAKLGLAAGAGSSPTSGQRARRNVAEHNYEVKGVSSMDDGTAKAVQRAGRGSRRHRRGGTEPEAKHVEYVMVKSKEFIVVSQPVVVWLRSPSRVEPEFPVAGRVGVDGTSGDAHSGRSAVQCTASAASSVSAVVEQVGVVSRAHRAVPKRSSVSGLQWWLARQLVAAQWLHGFSDSEYGQLATDVSAILAPSVVKGCQSLEHGLKSKAGTALLDEAEE